MLELFLSAFAMLFVVIDPPGCAPIFAGLTGNAPRAQARVMALRATTVAAAILVVFALFGEQLLASLHIELYAFRIAGGIMLFMIAIEMVFERRTQRREERAEKIKARNDQTPEIEDVSVFPMAMPMIAGPGSIATIMLLMAKSEGTDQTLVVLAALAAVLVFIGSKIFVSDFLLGDAKFPPVASLAVTFGLIATGIAWSLWKTRERAAHR